MTRAWQATGPVATRPVAAAVMAAAGMLVLSGTAAAETFSNPTPIVVPLPPPPEGCPDFESQSGCGDRAQPYPSTIAVDGLSGAVTDVNVTLHDLSYEFNGPADADIMLVGPDGTAVMVMSDACGDQDNHNPITSPITLTLDDQASAPLPADAPCNSGTFQPADDDTDEDFGFVAEDELPDAPAAGSAQLSSFNGTQPNGTWSLYVFDDYPNDPNAERGAGQIAGGWTLEVLSGGGAAPAATDTTATQAPTSAAPSNAPAPTATTAPPASGGQLADTGIDAAQPVAGILLLLLGWAMVSYSDRKTPLPPGVYTFRR